MQLESDVPVSEELEGALEAGLAKMGAAGTRLVIAADFAARVALLADEEGYGSDRIGGYVGGRAVRTSDGEDVIVVNARALEEDLDVTGAERLVAHEAGHVLIYQANEDVAWVETADLEDVGWRQVMMALAAAAIEEYRVEKAVMGLGYPVHHDVTLEGVADALMDANATPLNALFAMRANGDVVAARDQVFEEVSRFSKQLAHLVAGQPYAPLNVGELDPAAQANWAALAAPVWVSQLGFYEPVPDACTRWDRTSVLTTVTRGGELMSTLMGWLGFESSGGNDDEQFWSVRSDAMVEAALARYRADVEQRGDS